MTQAGVTATLVGGDGIKDDAYIQGAGQGAEGTLASTVGAPVTSVKTAAKFLKAYKKADFEEPASDFGPYAYDAANLIINSAKKVLKGEDSIPQDARLQIVKAIQKTKTKGASGKIEFDEFGDTAHIHFTLFRVEDGEWTPIKP
jgi:branched-chain amino acid transport system substrate-binding protein